MKFFGGLFLEFNIVRKRFSYVFTDLFYLSSKYFLFENVWIKVNFFCQFRSGGLFFSIFHHYFAVFSSPLLGVQILLVGRGEKGLSKILRERANSFMDWKENNFYWMLVFCFERPWWDRKYIQLYPRSYCKIINDGNFFLNFKNKNWKVNLRNDCSKE